MINGHQPKGQRPLVTRPPNQGSGGQKEVSNPIYVHHNSLAFNLSKIVAVWAQGERIIRFIWSGGESEFFDVTFPTQEERDADFEKIISKWKRVA